MADADEVMDEFHETLKEELLSLLYRLERLEQLRAGTTGMVLTTLPPLDTPAERDEAIAAIHARLLLLEQDLEEA